MKREEVEVYYDGYCPLGAVCSKGGGKLASKSSLIECKAVVMNHLMRSPYHGLEPVMAEDALLAETGSMEAWVRTVQYRVVVELDELGMEISKTYDDGTVITSGVQNDLRRKRTAAAADLHPDDDPRRRAIAGPPVPAVLATTMPQYTVPQRSSHVTISRVELDEMCDCFSRAEHSLSHAATMAAKAAKAFEEETSAIRTCRHHLERFRRA